MLLTSQIDNVKVYAAGATITRVAYLQTPAEQVTEQVEIAELPLALDDRTVRVRVEAEQHPTPVATDVRIGLAVPPRPQSQEPPLDEAVRAAYREVQRIQDGIALISREISVLSQLTIPDRPDGEEGKAPPPSPSAARLTLSNFKDEQIRARLQERREQQDKLRQAQEHWEDLRQQQALASTAREAKEHELRKTVVISLSLVPASSLKVFVEYFVPGARWTPTYVCRLDSRANTAAIAVRALICQRTGEDWSGVRLELSTAEPLAWCELPELPSLRLGRAQAVPQKSGWRSPPVGAESLFEDFDRQQITAKAALTQSTDLSTVRVSSVSLSPLPPLESSFPQAQAADRQAPEFYGAGAMFLAATEGEASGQMQDEYAELEVLLSSAPGGLRDQPIPPPAPAAYAPEQFQAVRSRATSPSKGGAQAKRESRREQTPAVEMEFQVQETNTEKLAYGLMRLGAAEDRNQRGKLAIAPQQSLYVESLQRLNVTIHFDVLNVVQTAVSTAQSCLYTSLPPGGINVRTVAGSFDYAYRADGRVDVPSDGQFHSIALTSQITDVNLRYVVVPREDTNVFRIAQLRNPLQAPLLAGSADVYVDGEYVLSTAIATVPPQGQMELGLGVEQGIKVARNISYQEARSGKILVAFNELCHQIQIAISNNLAKPARIEVRERVPIPQEGAKVDVHVDQVSPTWEKYEQVEREAPIQGGYRWQVQVPAGEQTTLSMQYTIKTYADSEVIGGNRREA